ncbi:MAG TPA: kdo(2)-lipid A phosphoethanolamine 7''-transferase [Burkholderiales bacterium]|nr:kdo(2)-lipid A phosphoethanolamine 7''-transferase [Burkholderiales bacterium]
MRRPVCGWHFPIVAISIYIALLFNSVEAIRRFAAHQDNHLSAFGLIGLELLLVISVTAGLFYLASLAGQVVFKSVAAFVLIFSAVSAYYMTFFNVVIGFGIIQATLTTDLDLSKEVVGAGVIAFVLVFGVLPAAAVALTRLNPGRRMGRIAMLAACGLAGFCVVFIYPYLLQNTSGRAQSQSASPLGVVVHSYVPGNWITGLAMSLSSRYESLARRETLMNPADKFTYRAGTNLEETYLVIVIGESARYDRMGILGHYRPNTPELSAMPGLVAMRATSCNTSTRLSLQCMFVRPEGVDDGGDSGKQTVSEEMVFAVLKKLGFTSELFAMQGEVWFYNSVNTNYYKHREIIYAREENIGKPIDDLVLVRELGESVARYPRGKHLVVLHSKGSHHLYTYRYPRSFAWYTPECMSVDVPCNREELLNSYDNSIAYTDHFLGQVIGTLENKKAIVIYTSDHGESIGEKAYLHGAPKSMAPAEQRMVPMIIWASRPFLSDTRNALNFAGLQTRKDGMADHHFLFDSILGCLGIESDNGGLNQSRNLCARK